MSEQGAHASRERALAGAGTRPPGVRPEITASWRRVRAGGLAPGTEPQVPPLSEDEVAARRATSALAPLLPLLRGSLAPVVDDGHLVVLCDRDGRVLWRDGRGGVRRLADRLGFVGGSAWTEANVGTNAIGTCLVEDAPVHVAGPEHYVESHVRWSCAAAPVHDPWTGEVVGALDVSGPAASVRRSMLALVGTTARLAETEVRRDHAVALDRLRAHAAPVLARLPGHVLALDHTGRVAAVTGGPAPARVLLPASTGPASTWLPSLGAVALEPLPGGWLVRVLADGSASELAPGTGTRVVLDLGGARPELRVSTSHHDWTHAPSPRHAQILELLVRHREGRTAAELADALFGDPARVGTVRAEVSRLRRSLRTLLETQPYRLAPGVEARIAGSGKGSGPG